jgi:ribosomal protein S18 acetylase RimI-like enzyme
VTEPPAGAAEIVPYRRELLAGILAVAAAEGWPSLVADEERAHRVLTAPGVTTVVATAGEVVGFAQLQSDGEIQAHLSLIAVVPAWRRQGIGGRLVAEALHRGGGLRVGLVTDSADAFYKSLPHRRFEGYRLYPRGERPAGSSPASKRPSGRAAKPPRRAA